MKLCITIEKLIWPIMRKINQPPNPNIARGQGTVDRKGRKRVPRITCRYISVKISNSSLSSVFPPHRTAVAVGIILKWPQNPEFLPSVAATAAGRMAPPIASITITTIPHVCGDTALLHTSRLTDAFFTTEYLEGVATPFLRHQKYSKTFIKSAKFRADKRQAVFTWQAVSA